MTGTVTFRFFAGAARAMGTREKRVEVAEPAPLAELVSALGASGEAARVLGLCTWLVDAAPAEADTPVGPGAQVDALPPFAGG